MNLKDEAAEALKSKDNAVGLAVNAFPTMDSDELAGVNWKEQKEHPPVSVTFQLTISDPDNGVVVLPSVVIVPLMPGTGVRKEARV